jgi:hypothetical protein
MGHHRSFAKSGGNTIRQSSATLTARDLNGTQRSRSHPVIWCRAVDDVIPTLSCKMIPKASSD